MSDDQLFEIHPLELFPYENLIPEITRKQFFEGLKVELDMYTHHRFGVKIGELGLFSNEDLYEIIPGVLPGTEILVCGREVRAVPKGKTDAVFLFIIEKPVLYIFNHINGKESLKEIAEEFSQQFNLPFDRAFLFTRGLFLSLVKAGVCLPVNNPALG